MEVQPLENRPALQRTLHRGTHPRTRSYRARTSRAFFEHVFNAPRSTNGGNPTDKFATECHEVEGDIYRLGLGRHAEHAARCVELSLIHDDVLPHPAVAASPRWFLDGLARGTRQIHFFDVCHMSPICMNRIICL